MNVADAETKFAALVDKVYTEGISIDLERENKILARVTPSSPRSPLTIGQLNSFSRVLGLQVIPFAP